MIIDAICMKIGDIVYTNDGDKFKIIDRYKVLRLSEGTIHDLYIFKGDWHIMCSPVIKETPKETETSPSRKWGFKNLFT